MRDFIVSAKAARVWQASILMERLLFEGDSDEWLASKDKLQEHLTETDLATLAFIALRCLPDDLAAQAADSALGYSGGPPVPLDDNVMQDARWWADGASERELKAYAIASYHRMSPAARDGFKTWALKQ